MTDQKQHIESLIAKAADAKDSNDAMRYAQAALNAANALCSLSAAMKQGN